MALTLDAEPGDDPRAAMRRRQQVLHTVDLSYTHGRGPMLMVASGRGAILDPGTLKSFITKEPKSTRLELRRSMYFAPDLAVGAVFLVKTLRGRYVLLRLESIEEDEARIRWVLDRVGDGKFNLSEKSWESEAGALPQKEPARPSKL